MGRHEHFHRLARRGACGALVLAAGALAQAASDASASPAALLAVTVSDVAPVKTLDDYYIGVNLDTGSLYNNIDLTDPVLTQLAANLAPAQARGLPVTAGNGPCLASRSSPVTTPC